jgi:multidrug efflux pump subunit AcrB
MEGPQQQVTLDTNDQLTDASQFRNVIVTYQNGAPVTLGDIGDVVNSALNTRTGAWYDTKPAELLLIFRAANANTVQVVDDVKSKLPDLEKSIPAAVRVDLLSDRSQMIRESVSDVERTLLITAVLVVLVIFAFLRKPWATVIPSVTVPIAIIGTFGIMYLFGYSLDNLSLMALSIAIGFVVDDAIVIWRMTEFRVTPAFEGPLKTGVD